jgi:hypothetical protein
MIQRVRRAVLIAFALVATPAPVPSQDLATPASSAGKLAGETAVHSEDGRRIGRLEANVTYSAVTHTGSTELCSCR